MRPSAFFVRTDGVDTRCTVCDLDIEGSHDDVAAHFLERADASDPGHVMWLNRNITKRKTDANSLARQLRTHDERTRVLPTWMKRTFIERFLGERPHPFVQALQRPSRAVLIGYVLEHQHFLRQWVRSCASVIAGTDRPDVTLYEIDNIATEFGGRGPERPSHYELLLRMGEDLGLRREEVLSTPPLPATRLSLDTWRDMAENAHWLETMAAMHGLELIANRNLRKEGATVHYFDPAILDDDAVSPAVKAFLREGYEADVGHSEEALALVGKYATELHMEERVRAAFLISLEAFDGYLQARLERSMQYESA